MLCAAAGLVAEVGLNSFTIDEVARRSGVAKTTIYRHFDSKNELLIAALDGTTPVPGTPDHGNLRDDLRDYLAMVRPIFADANLRATLLELIAASARDPELGQVHMSMVEGRSGPLTTIFERAKERGEIAPDTSYIDALDFMEGPFMVRSLIEPSRLDALDLERTIDRIIGALSAEANGEPR